MLKNKNDHWYAQSHHISGRTFHQNEADLIGWMKTHRSFVCSIGLLQYFTHSRKNNFVSNEIRSELHCDMMGIAGFVRFYSYAFNCAICFTELPLFDGISWVNDKARQQKKLGGVLFYCIMKSLNKILREFRVYVLYR